MTLQSLTKATQLIHHRSATRSDKGVQYCSWTNVDLLKDVNVKGFISFCEASEVIDRVIKTYNDYRPHVSLDYRTPKQVCQYADNQILSWCQYKK